MLGAMLYQPLALAAVLGANEPLGVLRSIFTVAEAVDDPTLPEVSIERKHSWLVPSFKK